MSGPATPLPADPNAVADERTTLVEFLEYYRAVFIRKVEGLSDEDARRATCPPSILTPMGLVRHMAEVERSWFRRGVGDEGDLAPPIYYSDDDPDGDFHLGSQDQLADAVATWSGEVAAAGRYFATARFDDVVGDHRRKSVRWIVVHLIEEYARHCGHLDLIVEAIDGRKGD